MKSVVSLLLVVSVAFSAVNSGIIKIARKQDGRSNWEAVKLHLEELHELVLTTMVTIFDEAMLDNAQIGPIIGKKVNDAAEHGVDLLYIVQREVETERLTIELAKQHLGELLVVISDLYASIEVDLFQLSDLARGKINAQFSYLYLHVPGIADKVYKALEEANPPSCGIVGYPSNETVVPSNPLDSELPPGTEVWRETIFSTEYISILIHPHNRYLDSEITADSLWIQTTQDFPNFLDENSEPNIHRVLIFHCTDNTEVLYEFVFPVTDGPIVEPTLPPSTASPQ